MTYLEFDVLSISDQISTYFEIKLLIDSIKNLHISENGRETNTWLHLFSLNCGEY